VIEYVGWLFVDVCCEVGVMYVVKGLCGGSDFDYELLMVFMNWYFIGVEMVFVVVDLCLVYVLSLLVC